METSSKSFTVKLNMAHWALLPSYLINILIIFNLLTRSLIPWMQKILLITMALLAVGTVVLVSYVLKEKKKKYPVKLTDEFIAIGDSPKHCFPLSGIKKIRLHKNYFVVDTGTLRKYVYLVDRTDISEIISILRQYTSENGMKFECNE